MAQKVQVHSDVMSVGEMSVGPVRWFLRLDVACSALRVGTEDVWT